MVLKMSRDLFHKLMVMGETRNIDIEKVLSFTLGPLPYSLATQYGELTKTVKSELLHQLETLSPLADEPDRSLDQAVLVDAMVVINAIKLDESNKTNFKFKDLAARVLKTAVKDSPNTIGTTVYFTNDTYPELSPKYAERDARELSAGGSFATTINSREQKVDSQFKKALRDKDFKESLAKFFVDEWQHPDYSTIIQHRTLIATAKEKCYQYQVMARRIIRTEVSELEFHLEEADQRLIFHAQHASQENLNRIVVFRSVDTDVVVLAIAACGMKWITASCLFRIGTGIRSRILNVNAIAEKLGDKACNALIGAHVFTGADCTSAFKGKGKSSVLWLIQNNDTFSDAMAMLGHSFDIDDSTMTACEAATCVLYCYNSRAKKNKMKTVPTHNVNQMRYIMFTSGTSNPEELPPCKNALRQHVMRANYMAKIGKCAVDPPTSVPSPHGRGWRVADNNIEIQWMDDLPAPDELLKLCSCKCPGKEKPCATKRCTCKTNKLMCTTFCSCITDICQNKVHISDREVDASVTLRGETSCSTDGPQEETDVDTDDLYSRDDTSDTDDTSDWSQ